MNHHCAAAILAAALLVPSSPASAETDRPPDRPERPSHLLTVGRAYTIEAKGCESRVTHFHVTAIQPIDRSKSDKDQILSGVFFRKRDVTGHSGWRNVGLPSIGADGRSQLKNPPLALDLHYLLTAYGSSDWQAEALLGYGVLMLHQNPVLARDDIRSADPWVRGSTPTSHQMGRISSVRRPSGRMPSLRIAARTAFLTSDS